MAAPADKNLKNLNGRWQFSHKLSDSLEGGLKLQGVPWLIRKAFGNAPLYLKVEQLEEEGVPRLRTTQTTVGGAPAGGDNYTLDWTFRERETDTGKLRGRVGYRDLDGIADADFLHDNWLEDGNQHIEIEAENLTHGWTSHQVWGFDSVEGERHFVVRIVVRKGDAVERARLVYDFVGE